jgi:hypothetical protein
MRWVDGTFGHDVGSPLDGAITPHIQDAMDLLNAAKGEPWNDKLVASAEIEGVGAMHVHKFLTEVTYHISQEWLDKENHEDDESVGDDGCSSHER